MRRAKSPLQVEFNPAAVTAYRLIGYEKRLLQNEDFNNDRKDAGEMGAGHSVTALYEIVPAGAAVDLPLVDPLEYQARAADTGAGAGELMTLEIRYKDPDGETSRLMTVAVRNRVDAEAPARLGFAASVAEFGMLLRSSEHRGAATWQQTADLARRHRGADPDGYRAEFVRLVELADSLAAQRATRRATVSSPWCKSLLHSTGEASPPAAWLLAHILPVCSVVAPCRRGASPVSVRRQTCTTGC